MKKFAAVAAVLFLAMSLVAVSFDEAEAKRGRRAAFVGGLALGALAIGALSADAHGHYNDDRCYRGPRRCHWVRGECYRDRWGDVECEPGYKSCYRPLICE